jgi:hypothetical protein
MHIADTHVFPDAAENMDPVGCYTKRYGWLLEEGADGAVQGAASGAHAKHERRPVTGRHWLARHNYDAITLQKLLLKTLDPASDKLFGGDLWRLPLERCMQTKPDVLYLGGVAATPEEFALNYDSDNGRLLKDMFEKHDGEMALLSKMVTAEKVPTPLLPWLEVGMLWKLCFNTLSLDILEKHNNEGGL